MTKKFVSVSFEDLIGVITLTHSAKRNCLSEALVEEVIDAMNDLRSQKSRVIILRAEKGVKVFSAGHDVSELPETHRDPLSWEDSLLRLVRTIKELPVPVIAMVEGSVWGGASEVVFACDLVIAENNSSFAFTPAKIGVPYNISGLLTFLNSVPTHVLKEMIFTAMPISATRAQEIGIVNHVFSLDELEEKTFAIAKQITVNAPLAISAMKLEVGCLSGASPFSPRTFEMLQGLRRGVYDSKDYQEGIRAFREKRKPNFTGE